MANEDFNKMMDSMLEVPGAKEHLETFSIVMAENILTRRKELNLTQTQLVDLLKHQGDSITQTTLSRIESGDENIKASTYNKVFKALGGIKSIDVRFKKRPLVSGARERRPRRKLMQKSL